jgi:hypothetical protein
MNVSYSVWPFILIPYNLPPWVCMKQSNFILSVLFLGKRALGKDIDVYMQLVIDDLFELWKPGVMTYDVSYNKKFHLHTALPWTISDWLGRGLLSRESIAACSHCLTDTCWLRLKHGHKSCYTDIVDSKMLITDSDFKLDYLMVPMTFVSLLSNFQVGNIWNDKRRGNSIEKSLLHPQLWGWSTLLAPNYETVYSTSWTLQNRPNHPVKRFWTVVLLQ